MSRGNDSINVLEFVPIAMAIAGVIRAAIITRPLYTAVETTTRCPTCNYDIRGLPLDGLSGLCPECGSHFIERTWRPSGREILFSRRVYLAFVLLALTPLIPWIVTIIGAPLVGLFDPYYERGIWGSFSRSSYRGDFNGCQVMVAGAVCATTMPMFLIPRSSVKSWSLRIAAALLIWIAVYIASASPQIMLRGHLWDSPPGGPLLAVGIGAFIALCPKPARLTARIRALIPLRHARARPSSAISQASQDPTA